jgi:hypothetical protein
MKTTEGLVCGMQDLKMTDTCSKLIFFVNGKKVNRKSWLIIPKSAIFPHISKLV